MIRLALPLIALVTVASFDDNTMKSSRRAPEPPKAAAVSTPCVKPNAQSTRAAVPNNGQKTRTTNR